MNTFMLFPPPGDLPYRLLLLAAAAINLVLALFTELFLCDTLLRKAIRSRDKGWQVSSAFAILWK